MITGLITQFLLITQVFQELGPQSFSVSDSELDKEFKLFVSRKVKDMGYKHSTKCQVFGHSTVINIDVNRKKTCKGHLGDANGVNNVFFVFSYN